MAPAKKSLPVVECTLRGDDAAERVLEWDDLRSLSLHTERITGGVTSTYPLEYGERIEDLARRERGCCGGWLTVHTERLADAFRLRLTTTNPDGEQVILAMAGHEPT